MRTPTRSLLLALLLLSASPARAALGGTAASVEADRRALSAARLATTTQASYRVEEVQAEGCRVRQYVSAAGVVFGVAWDGVSLPDIETLLGSYATAWREADDQAPRTPGRRHRTVTATNLVVERWGHMRDLRGRAYDPAILPAGVTADEIR
jgi:hypothetical protein